MGDVILTSPAIRLIRKRFPGCTIDFVVKKQFSSLLSTHPFINSLLIFDKNKNGNPLKQLKRQIKRNNYDIIFDLHKNLRSYYLSTNSGAQQIFRYKKFVLRRLLLVKFKINLFKQPIPIYQRYLIALSHLGIIDDNQGLDLYLDENIKNNISSFYADFFKSPGQQILGVAPGASFPTKRWTSAGFEQVINHFLEQKNLLIILFGNSEDRELIKSLNIKVSPNILNVAGSMSIAETAALMNHCNVVLTNDTGLMHMAAALKKKIVAIFGSTTRELGFFPVSGDSIVIENKNVRCRPCSHVGRKNCPKEHFKCMKEIQPAEIIKAISSFFV
ncbi:hypothetical protein B6I21_08325 [candidate division KSB1 bacterium 4572_119]|nr:MAG: hypothetical protein B6I21_08325 [candidate division KSB1 bacterium 4572_119]